MSVDLEHWLARPTTTTSSTTSDMTFSFPTISSSTTDWLKHPISSTPNITMATTPKKETESSDWPASSFQGIQMWLTNVEPFNFIEDDFEIVDEETSSIEDGSLNLETKPYVGFAIPKLEVKESPKSDLDIWLKKEPIPLKTSCKHLEQDERLATDVISEDEKVSLDTGIWIISQSKKGSEKTTFADYEMFNHLRQESNNLMDWIKKEMTKDPDEASEVYNPLTAWNDFHKSIVWIHESNPDRRESSMSHIRSGNTDKWLHKRSSNNSLDKSTTVQNKEPIKPEDTSYTKWLKKETPVKKIETRVNSTFGNWDNILRQSNKDSEATLINPTENANKIWLLPSKDEEQCKIKKPTESSLHVNKKDNKKWIYEEARDSEITEHPISFFSEQNEKWLFRKN